MAGRAGGAGPNVKGLLDTSAVAVPLGAALKPNATAAVGTAEGVAEEPKLKPVVGFFSVAVVPKENGVTEGFSSAGAVLERCPKENGVAGGGVPNSDLGVSALDAAATGVGVVVEAAGAGG